MTTKKAAKKTAKKNASGRKSIPYVVIAKMVEDGADALTIAKKIGRVNGGKDKTHTVRAILSGMRTRGWKDESGKTMKLKVKRLGQPREKASEKEQKATKKLVKKTAPKSSAATTPLDGKTLAAGGE